jgi:hypothetical protein
MTLGTSNQNEYSNNINQIGRSFPLMDVVHSRAEDEDETSSLTYNNKQHSLQVTLDDEMDEIRIGESPRLMNEDINYQ